MAKAIASAQGKEHFPSYGGRRSHNQKYKNPWHLIHQQPGHKMPSAIEGGMYGAGLPSNFSGKQIPAAPWTRNHAVWKNANDLHIAKYGGGSGGADDPSWHEGWYKPYVQSRVEAPIRQIIGMPGGTAPNFATQNRGRGGSFSPAVSEFKSMIDPEKTEFMPVSDILSEIPEAQELWNALNPVLSAPGSVTQEMGYDNLQYLKVI